MTAAAWAGALLLGAALLLVSQMMRALGLARGLALAALLLGALGVGWALLGRGSPAADAPADWSAVASVPAETCAKCHAEHYESWHRTYHRTMTRDAAPDTVKGDFENAVYDYQGLKSTLTREGDQFFMTTVDRDWALRKARTPDDPRVGPPQYTKVKVDRCVGSHWAQEYLHREPNGQYTRLPLMYSIVEKRWLHNHGGFLMPDDPDFWKKCRGFTWNDTCLYCHNTAPVKNRQVNGRGEVTFNSQVAELGISCEACHGPGGHHAEVNANPARRFELAQSTSGDPSIVNPLRLSVPRRDEICARCHGALVPKRDKWDARSHRDPYIAGQELGKFNHFFSSEKEQLEFAGLRKPNDPTPPPPDGRFWPDGTPLTTALEYNGMALSACYQQGHGQMSCLSCHTLHGEDPNFLLKPGMKTNEACLQCHGEYRERVAEHTRHAAGSAGSQCVSCHMPHLVYSLLTTHRSHRIEIPQVKDSAGTGKPHACNLCHLDKSLGWTQEQLAKWPNGSKRVVKLSEEEEKLSAALLLLAKGDARSRALVAGAFSNPAALEASGTDWFAPFLTRLMAEERYPIVRYLAHRGLKSAHATAAADYDYLALPTQRQLQLAGLRARFDLPLTRPLPYLPLDPRGRPDETVLRRLLAQRRDPDVAINE